MANYPKYHAMPTMKQQGFTLIELMISLTIGLLIAAAAIQVYITSLQTGTTQKSTGEVQGAGIFGVQQIEYYLRLANLGSEDGVINNKNPSSGIVFNADNVQNATGVNWAALNMVTTDDPRRTGNSSLVIQFTNVPAAKDAAGADVGVVQLDCENNEVAVNARVIQRYFLTSDGLRCDAGRINVTPARAASGSTPASPASATVTNYGDDGVMAVAGAERFIIKLGLKHDEGANRGKMIWAWSGRYQSSAKLPAVVAVKMGILVKGDTPVLRFGGDVEKKTVDVLDFPVEVTTDRVRHVFETTTLLRNGRFS